MTQSDGPVCLITGANRGLGLALALELRARGSQVIGTAREPDRAGELRTSGADVLCLDITSDESIKAFVHELGGRGVDVLINNAGILGNERSSSRHGPRFGSIEREDMERTFSVNTASPLMLVQALRANLDSGTRRQVVNISSTLGSLALTDSGEPWAYRASKAALNMVTRSLACEMELSGYTVVAVHPGWVRTEMGGEGADIAAQESAQCLAAFIDGLTPAMNGSFFDRFGSVLAW